MSIEVTIYYDYTKEGGRKEGKNEKREGKDVKKEEKKEKNYKRPRLYFTVVTHYFLDPR